VPNQIFLLYCNLLSEEAKHPRNKMLVEQAGLQSVDGPAWSRTYCPSTQDVGLLFGVFHLPPFSDMMQQRHKGIALVIA
jgi:hypothetical protein